MKSDKTKWIIFIVLISIAAVIWIRNLNLFSSDPEFFQVRKSETKSSINNKQLVKEIAYKTPKINPFIEHKPVSQPQAKKQLPPTKKASSQKPGFISNFFSIDGIVIESSNPQAILKKTDGTTKLITINDSLNNWVVSGIFEDKVVFSQDKYRDTIFLKK